MTLTCAASRDTIQPGARDGLDRGIGVKMIYFSACCVLAILVFRMAACDGRAAVADEPGASDATRDSIDSESII